MSSSYGTNFPPLPAFKSVIASNNVYANVVDPLTVIGSGGGAVPANLAVSTLTVAGAPVSGGYGGVTIDTNPDLSYASVPIVFNSAGQDNVDAGQLQIRKTGWGGINSENIFGLGVTAFSTVSGSYQPLCCGDLYVNNSDGTGDGTGRITYVDAVSTLSLTAAGPTGNVTISSIVTSTINGTSWPALVSTVNGGGGGGGAVPANLAVSTLTVAGANVYGGPAGVTIDKNINYNVASLPIFFNNVGQDNISSGQLQILKYLWPGINGETVYGLGVSAFSTVFGSFQPVCCGDLYVNNGDSVGQGTGRITYVDALSTMSLTASGATGNVTISSCVTSTINGTSWPALVSTVIGLNGGNPI